MRAGEVVDLRDLERGKRVCRRVFITVKVLLYVMWHKIPFPPQEGFRKFLHCFTDFCVRCFLI